MEPNTQPNPSGMMNGMPPVSKENRRAGPIIGLLAIVLIIIIAVLYFIGQKSIDSEVNMDETLNTPNTSQTTQTNPEQTTSQNTTPNNTANASDVDSEAQIEADLNSQLDDVDYSF